VNRWYRQGNLVALGLRNHHDNVVPGEQTFETAFDWRVATIRLAFSECSAEQDLYTAQQRNIAGAEAANRNPVR
jgi:hypothetical protein